MTLLRTMMLVMLACLQTRPTYAADNLTETVLSIEEIRFGEPISSDFVTKLVVIMEEYIWTESVKAPLTEALERAVRLGMSRTHAQSYGVSDSANSYNTAEDLQLKVINMSREVGYASHVHVLFAVHYMGALVKAARIVEDIEQLTNEELTLQLGYAFHSINAYAGTASTETRRLWIIGAVIGGVLAILLCGWCFLFAYYNACASPTPQSTSKSGKSLPQLSQTQLQQKYTIETNNKSLTTGLESNIQREPKETKSTETQVNGSVNDVQLYVTQHDSPAPILYNAGDVEIGSVKVASQSRNETLIHQNHALSAEELQSKTPGDILQPWNPHLAGDLVQPIILKETQSRHSHPSPAETQSTQVPTFYSADFLSQSSISNITSTQLIKDAFFSNRYP